MHPLRVLSVALPLLLTACVGPRQVRCPSEGGTPWVELKSTNFTLLTDLPPTEADKAVTYLEQTRSALLAAVWPGVPDTPDDARVVVLSDPRDYDVLLDRRVQGLALSGQGRTSVLLYGRPDSWEHREVLNSQVGASSVLKHELAHMLSARYLARQPRWLAEGLAEFLETLELSADGRSAVLGKPNLDDMRLYRSARSLSVGDALGWRGALDAHDEGTTGGLYGLSWLMVHWLYNTRNEQFFAYQHRLARGEEPREAWNAVFPDLSPEAAGVELHRYIKTGDYQEFDVTVPPVPLEVRRRALSDPEVHTLHAELALIGAGAFQDGAEAKRDFAQRELAQALSHEPAHVRALQLKAQELEPAGRIALARQATAAHPEDPAAWRFLGGVLGDVPEAESEKLAAYEKALALGDTDPQTANNLAWSYAKIGRHAEALSLAERALKVAFADPAVLDTYAVVLAGMGRCGEAVSAEQRAIELLPDGASAAAAREFQQRLEQFRQDCRARPQPTAAPVTP
jgi:Flp pilus assembly protein TadD